MSVGVSRRHHSLSLRRLSDSALILDLKTGQAAWQNRSFAQATLIHADGKAIIIDEDGDLALARLTPEGATVLSQVKLFDTVSWTVPTLAGTTLYARDRAKIVALDLGAR